MRETLQKKYPNLKIKLQNKYVYKKYPVTLSLFANSPFNLDLQEKLATLINSDKTNFSVLKEKFRGDPLLVELATLVRRKGYYASAYWYVTKIRAKTEEEISRAIDLSIKIVNEYSGIYTMEICAVPDGLPTDQVASTLKGGYEYKVFLWVEDKKQATQPLLEFLDSYSDQVRIPPSLRCQLIESPYLGTWLTNSYIYVKDEAMLMMLKLWSSTLFDRHEKLMRVERKKKTTKSDIVVNTSKELQI